MTRRLDHLHIRWDADQKLSFADEQALIALAQAGDNDAKQRLVDLHLAYALGIAKRWKPRMPGHDLEDLMQIAQLALLDCIKRYDAALGTRLITLATFRITHAIMQSISRDSLIRVPSYFHDKASAKERIALRARLRPCSLSLPVGENGDGTLGDLIGEPDRVAEDIDDRLRVAAVIRCLRMLNERMRGVLLDRMNGLVIEEIAAKLGVSRERVRQIEQSAIKRLTKYVTQDIAQRRRQAIVSQPIKSNRCAYREAMMRGGGD
jgi:RNA polymerase sigma factor (sigma-70 family)